MVAQLRRKEIAVVLGKTHGIDRLEVRIKDEYNSLSDVYTEVMTISCSLFLL
jgi:hypothetical protein